MTPIGWPARAVAEYERRNYQAAQAAATIATMMMIHRRIRSGGESRWELNEPAPYPGT
jgi:hypothetical protein